MKLCDGFRTLPAQGGGEQIDRVVDDQTISPEGVVVEV